MKFFERFRGDSGQEQSSKEVELEKLNQKKAELQVQVQEMEHYINKTASDSHHSDDGEKLLRLSQALEETNARIEELSNKESA